MCQNNLVKQYFVKIISSKLFRQKNFQIWRIKNYLTFSYQLYHLYHVLSYNFFWRIPFLTI